MTKLYEKLKLGMEYWKALTMIVTLFGLISSAAANYLQSKTSDQKDMELGQMSTALHELAVDYKPTLETLEPKIVNNCNCKRLIKEHIRIEH